MKKSKAQNHKDEPPIQLNYSQQLQNGHMPDPEQFQPKKQIMLISQDVLLNQDADQVIEDKKKEVRKNLGQKLK